jgi:hypothetical protein
MSNVKPFIVVGDQGGVMITDVSAVVRSGNHTHVYGPGRGHVSCVVFDDANGAIAKQISEAVEAYHDAALKQRIEDSRAAAGDGLLSGVAVRAY